MKYVVVTLIPGGACVPEGYGILFDGSWYAARGNPDAFDRVAKACDWMGPPRSQPTMAVSDAWVHAVGAAPVTGTGCRPVVMERND